MHFPEDCVDDLTQFFQGGQFFGAGSFRVGCEPWRNFPETNTFRVRVRLRVRMSVRVKVRVRVRLRVKVRVRVRVRVGV